ncbi:helix-turn-helix domain-containing protein [Metabacillus sp. 84]|uniref:helix-turn-helix domain-containing protein n=1 Tax=Metabacillus sp. 84 TaxID=3404705 RepID=UPI003CEF18CA
MQVGNRLRKAREKKRLSQIEVARRTPISNKALSRYETDGAEPDFDTLKLLADLYEVPVSYFFEETTSENIDLVDLLTEKKLMWGNEELNEAEKKRAIEILNILFNEKKDTTS